jgi:hypothetical protein
MTDTGDTPHGIIHVHGGGGREDHDRWLATAQATGTYPRTLEHANPALAGVAPMWVAIMEPWPGSPGDSLDASEQMSLLWDTAAPDGVDIYNTAAELPTERGAETERLVDQGRWNFISDMTGWEDRERNEGDFTIALFGELGDGLLATFIGLHTEHGSVRHASPLHLPERLIIAAADHESRPFVVRLAPGTGCPLADRLKQRVFAEVIIDQYTRLHSTTISDTFQPDED